MSGRGELAPLLLALAACGRSGPTPFVDVDRSIDRYDDLGLPLVGDLTFKAQLVSPKDEYATATGDVKVHCGHCVLGDGKAKIKPTTKNARSAAFVGDGIDFGTLDLGAIDGTATITNGKGVIDLQVGSPSIALTLTGTFTLANDLGTSDVDLQLAFKPTDALKNSDPKTYAVLVLTGASVDADGWSKIHMVGPAARPRMQNAGPDAVKRPHLRP